jgi:hypothetical protein
MKYLDTTATHAERHAIHGNLGSTVSFSNFLPVVTISLPIVSTYFCKNPMAYFAFEGNIDGVLKNK